MKRTLCAVGLVAVLFAVVATPARADKCTGAKLKAIKVIGGQHTLQGNRTE